MEAIELINLFLLELEEETEEFSATLLELDKNPENKELIDDLYINIHTIKGSSKSLFHSLTKGDHPETAYVELIANLSHRFETFLDGLKKKGFIAVDDIHLCFQFDRILKNIKNIFSERGDIAPAKESVTQYLQALDNSGGSAPPNSTKKHFFTITLSSDEEYKHGYLTIVYRDIEKKYKECYFSPTKEDLLLNKEFSTITLQIVSSDSENAILSFLQEIENVGSVSVIPNNIKTETPVNTIKQVIDLHAKELPPAKATKGKISPQTLKIETKRIDNVLKHTSKLVILSNKIDQFLIENDFLAGTNKRKELESIFNEINSHVYFLQESVLDIRMTPFEQLFSRFPMDIKEISENYGKAIKFNATGGSTEIDKSILDELFDPFMHLIRNAIIHGIERPEERAAKGKNPEGAISISAKHDKNRVIITISDDGKGIDLELVKMVAIEKNIVTPTAANNMTHNELLSLIFKSGVSTSDNVNEFSGRGIGMDAAKKKIEAINGYLNVTTETDVGTTITLYLPLTTSIIEGMITKINNEFFTFPITQVEEVINVKKSEIRFSSDKYYYFLKDKEIPIVYSDDFFGFKREDSEDSNPFVTIMILRSQNYTVGLTIDHYLGQRSIVVKNLHPFIQQARGISACNILGDGSISLIIDANDLIPFLTKN